MNLMNDYRKIMSSFQLKDNVLDRLVYQALNYKKYESKRTTNNQFSTGT